MSMIISITNAAIVQASERVVSRPNDRMSIDIHHSFVIVLQFFTHCSFSSPRCFLHKLLKTLVCGERDHLHHELAVTKKRIDLGFTLFFFLCFPLPLFLLVKICSVSHLCHPLFARTSAPTATRSACATVQDLVYPKTAGAIDDELSNPQAED